MNSTPTLAAEYTLRKVMQYVQHLLVPELVGSEDTFATHTVALGRGITGRVVIDNGITVSIQHDTENYTIHGSVFKVYRALHLDVDNPLISSMVCVPVLIMENAALETIHIGADYARALLATLAKSNSDGVYRVGDSYGSLEKGTTGILLTPFGLNDENGWFTSKVTKLIEHLTEFVSLV